MSWVQLLKKDIKSVSDAVISHAGGGDDLTQCRGH